MLQMIRSLPNGDLHRGVVQMPESGNISEGFMSYMQSSEQIATMVAVDVVLGDKGEVVAAGGYLVQILPEYRSARVPWALMTFRLEDFLDISERLRLHDASPDHLVEEIFYGMDYTLLGGLAAALRVQLQQRARHGQPAHAGR
jgi:molecular chaperone Hsp33